MNQLEQAKERLKSALTRLETAIESKIMRLEVENNALRKELASVASASEQAKPSSRSGAKKSSAVQQELLGEDEVMLSLNDLKKIVG